jgi:hypothetical protein
MEILNESVTPDRIRTIATTYPATPLAEIDSGKKKELAGVSLTLFFLTKRQNKR